MASGKADTEECYICGFVCTSRRMVAHIKSHTHVEIFECEICGDRFASKKTLQKHYITHKTHFICEHCNKKFVDPVRLRSHICFNPEENYTCETCGKEFVHQSRYMKHVATHSEEKVFTCKYCSKSFQHKRNLTRHMTTHSEHIEEGQQIDEIDQTYSCDVCNKECSNKSQLERHYMSHSDEKPYICLVCNRGFKYKGDMKSHEKLHFQQKGPHECAKCGKCFSRRSNLKVHYNMHLRRELGLPTLTFHNGKTFTCDVCNKNFISEKVLTQHQVTHTKEKPYACQYCEQRFSHDSCLKRHSYLHTEGAYRKRPKYSKNSEVTSGPDDEDDSRSYVCHVCQATFEEEIELRVHRKSFWRLQNYKCCKCFQVYRCKKKLREHEKVHDVSSTSSPLVCALRVEGRNTESEGDTRDADVEYEESSSSIFIGTVSMDSTESETDTRDVELESEESCSSQTEHALRIETESESDSRDVVVEDENSSSSTQNYQSSLA
nr:zinc finger protein 43 isoform X2 [Parasteatoda tepidariorum]